MIVEPSGGALDPGRLRAARWFAGKGARVERVRRLAVVSPPGALGQLAVLAIRTSDGAEELYTFPGELVGGELRESADPGLWRALFELAATGGTLEGDGCLLHGSAGPAPAGPRVADLERAADLEVSPLGVDQSHTTFVLGGGYALKCYRRLAPGRHPELELTSALTAAGFAHIPAVYGSAVLELDGERFGLLHLQAYLPDAEDGFAVAKRELGALLDATAADAESVLGAAGSAPVAWASACGRVLAEMHGVLATELGAGLATSADIGRWRRAALAQLEQAQSALDGSALDGSALATLRAARPRLDALLDGFRPEEPPLVCRIHGDLHVGQFLREPDGRLAIIDFEGEPGRPTGERRAPASPMRDLATLLRSFDHAGFWVRSLPRERAAAGRADADARAAEDAVAEAWIAAARDACIRGYRATAEAGASPALRFDPRLLAALEADKAVNELLYAHRVIPAWMGVATSALRRLCNSC